MELLQLISMLLPRVSDLNNKMLHVKKEGSDDKEASIRRSLASDITNAGTFYSWVESEHPYKPAVIAHYK